MQVRPYRALFSALGLSRGEEVMEIKFFSTEGGLCRKQGGGIIRKEFMGGGISSPVAKAGICEAAWLEKPASGKLQKRIPGRQK